MQLISPGELATTHFCEICSEARAKMKRSSFFSLSAERLHVSHNRCYYCITSGLNRFVCFVIIVISPHTGFAFKSLPLFPNNVPRPGTVLYVKATRNPLSGGPRLTHSGAAKRVAFCLAWKIWQLCIDGDCKGFELKLRWEGLIQRTWSWRLDL